MKKFFATILLAVAMTACASLEAQSPAQRVFAAGADYNVALRVFASYESLPRCAADAKVFSACSRLEVVDVGRRTDKAASAALDAAEVVVRNPDAKDAWSMAAASAEQAVGVFRKVLTDNGVLK